MMYPASIVIFLFLILLVALAVVLVTCRSAAKASLVFGIISLLFLVLGILKDFLFNYNYLDIGALGLSFIVSGIAIILALLAVLRPKQKVNTRVRHIAMAGIIIGIFSFVLIIGYIAWIFITHPNQYP